jgi:hypothetical protein
MTASNPVVKRAFKLPENITSLSTVESDTNKPLAAPVGLLPTFVPSTEEEMVKCLADPLWRICSGQIYKIAVKAPDEADNTALPFIPNRKTRQRTTV